MSVPALDPGRGLFRGKSPAAESVTRVRSPSPPGVRAPIKVQERFKSPEPRQTPLKPKTVFKSDQEKNGVVGKSMGSGIANGVNGLPGTSTTQMEATDDQGYTRKKVVKVIRRVVRKVLPSEEEEISVPAKKSDEPAAEPTKVGVAAAPASVQKTRVMTGFSFKHDVIKTDDKDDISRGLTSLTVRGRTREPRPRIFRDEPEKAELNKINEKMEKKPELEDTKKEQNENKTNTKSQDVNHKSTSSSPITKGVTSPVVSVNPVNKATVSSAPYSSKSLQSRPLSLPSVVGFIPAPKPTPLASPPPTSNLTTTSSRALKSSPSHFTLANKSSVTATSVDSDPPQHSAGPLSLPTGSIPIQQPTVSQHEVQCDTLHVFLTFGTLVLRAWAFEMHI